MALFTLSVAGLLYDVLEGTLSLGPEGAWSASLVLSVAPELDPAELLVARDGEEPERFVGTIITSAAFEGRAYVELVAGAGGLASQALAAHYTGAVSKVSLAELVEGIVAGAGEQLAEGVAAALPAVQASRWTRLGGETWAQALSRVTRRYGLAWRILDTGLVWVGAETWPAEATDPFLLDDDQAARTLVVAFDRAVYRPGMTVLGRRIVRVTYSSSGRADLEYDESDVDLLRRLVARLSAPSPYALTYAAEVVTQNADGTLDLKLVDGPIIDMPRVPFVAGLAGGRFLVAAGDVLRVAFLGGRPDGAVAYALAGDETATAAVARKGDSVNCGTLAAALVGGAVQLTYTPPGGVPGAPAAAVSLQGVISSGSEEIFIR